MSDPGAELVDIVDDADRVVAVATRREVRARVLKHRCVFIAVRSSRGEVLIHRRSDRKDLWPGFWDLCAGGVLASGEDWDDGARRELAEELGVAGALAMVGTATYRDADVDVIARLYTVSHDGPFAFNDGEVVEAFFVTLDDLAARLARDRFVPDSVAIAWPLIKP
jgi:isopentenyldiphosphate isomerase